MKTYNIPEEILLEEWVDIKGYEGRYQINRNGAIRRLKSGSSKITFPGSKMNGYYNTGLSLNKKGKSFLIHRLVATAFIPNPENKPFVNHINGNKLDNRVENLEWVTLTENNQHAWNTGLTNWCGERCNLSKLKDKDVELIFVDKRPVKIIAEEYNVTASAIYNIKRGVRWGRITSKIKTK